MAQFDHVECWGTEEAVRIIQYHRRVASGDGGITNSVRELSMAMARAGAEAVILADDDAPSVELPGVEWRQVHHRVVGPLAWPERVHAAIADADVVVLNSAWTLQNLVVGRVAERAGIPYVLAPRGAYDPGITSRRRALKRIWWPAGERHLVRRARAVHIFFDSERSHLGPLGFDGRVIVAPNGVRVPEGMRWTRDGEHLLYLGRFDPEHKGLDLLLRGLALTGADEVPPLHMHGSDWAGGKAEIARLVASLGLADRVVIGEHLSGDAKWEAIAGAKGFVYPSRWEAFGNSTAEAAALGVPTLVTPYPLGVYLAERGAAIMVDHTPTSLADGLRKLVAPASAAVGDAAAVCVREVFTWGAVAATWLDSLEDVL